MSYSCLEELQIDLDLRTLDKTNVLSNAGCEYKDGWLVVTDDGICHLFDKNGNLDDIKKIKQLDETHTRKDITKIIISDSVTNIGYAAFSFCRDLTSVAIPDSVTSIKQYAFIWCDKLTNLTIPDTVTSIGNNAFYRCTNLTNVMIGTNVTSIGMHAFLWCDKLINLTFKGKTFKQVKKMKGYPWGIEDESIIQNK